MLKRPTVADENTMLSFVYVESGNVVTFSIRSRTLRLLLISSSCLRPSDGVEEKKHRRWVSAYSTDDQTDRTRSRRDPAIPDR